MLASVVIVNKNVLTSGTEGYNMNKRIFELAEQAYEQKQSMVIDPNTYEMVPGKTYEMVLNQEKFAELIVRECITVLDENDGALHHTELLKKHFGDE
jgi:galactokinase